MQRQSLVNQQQHVRILETVGAKLHIKVKLRMRAVKLKKNFLCTKNVVS